MNGRVGVTRLPKKCFNRWKAEMAIAKCLSGFSRFLSIGDVFTGRLVSPPEGLIR